MNNNSINIMDILDNIVNYTDDMLFDKADELDIFLKESNNNIKMIDINDNNDKQLNCIKCINDDIILIDGNNICKKCGKLVSRSIEIGKNLFEHNNGYTLISTTLMPVNNNGSCGYTKTNSFNVNNFDITKDTRNIYQASKKIREICQMAKFSKKIEDTAKIMYISLKQDMKNMNKNTSRRDKKKNNLIAICLKEACISNKNLCNNKDFAKYCNIDPKELTKGSKMYAKLVRSNDNQPTRITCLDYIPKLCEDLLMDNVYMEEALKIAKNINKLYLCSNFVAPTVAPSVILIVIYKYNLPIPIKTLSQHSATSVPTINKCYNKISPYINIVVNDIKTDNILKQIYKKNIPKPSLFTNMYLNCLC